MVKVWLSLDNKMTWLPLEKWHKKLLLAVKPTIYPDPLTACQENVNLSFQAFGKKNTNAVVFLARTAS